MDRSSYLEKNELLLGGTEDLVRGYLENVEADGLAQRSALADGDDVSFLNSEAWADVDGDVGVSLLESVVLLDVVKIVSSDDDGAFHLGRDNQTPFIKPDIT